MQTFLLSSFFNSHPSTHKYISAIIADSTFINMISSSGVPTKCKVGTLGPVSTDTSFMVVLVLAPSCSEIQRVSSGVMRWGGGGAGDGGCTSAGGDNLC